MKTSANVTFLRWFCWMKDSLTLKGESESERERECLLLLILGATAFIHTYIVVCMSRRSFAHARTHTNPTLPHHRRHRIIIVVLQNAVEKRIFHHIFVVCIEIKFLLKPYSVWSCLHVRDLVACAFGGFCVWFFFLISCNDRQFQTNSHIFCAHTAHMHMHLLLLRQCNAVAFFISEMRKNVIFSSYLNNHSDAKISSTSSFLCFACAIASSIHICVCCLSNLLCMQWTSRRCAFQAKWTIKCREKGEIFHYSFVLLTRMKRLLDCVFPSHSAFGCHCHWACKNDDRTHIYFHCCTTQILLHNVAEGNFYYSSCALIY